MGVIHVIEYARNVGFRRLWLECDSILLVKLYPI